MAELAGMARTCGTLRITGEGASLLLSGEGGVVYDRAALLLATYFGARPRREENRGQVTAALPCDLTTRVLLGCNLAYRDEDGELLLYDGISGYAVMEDCCLKSYARGAFLGAGYVHMPYGGGESAGYRAEFLFASATVAADFVGILQRLDVAARRAARKDRTVVYVGGRGGVADLLGHIGAHKAAMEVHGTGLERGLNSTNNRRANAAAANLDRTFTAAARQVVAFTRLKEGGAWGTLPEPLRAAADARLAHPDATLTELAESAGIGKSVLVRRLQKLMNL
jgi:DNA-binding protein WhiA